ncbi:hypothetical protein GCM10010420_49280 [Streptomyces glaucosporus]|uniref:Secreted protein n=1 Tax=Streptomyces glaucosporus TaxID=284044 RepID=A0ABN3IVC1_9ACTN
MRRRVARERGGCSWGAWRAWLSAIHAVVSMLMASTSGFRLVLRTVWVQVGLRSREPRGRPEGGSGGAGRFRPAGEGSAPALCRGIIRETTDIDADCERPGPPDRTAPVSPLRAHPRAFQGER